jgi:transposase
LRYQGYVEDNANRPIHRAQRSTARDLRAIDSDQHPALYSDPSRLSLRSDASHSFVYTPKRASWLNQIELWFSILVRRLLKRASFTGVEQLNERVLAFIDYLNKTMAKPFKGTYTGRPLVV